MANPKEQTLEEKNIQLEKELANKIIELNQKNRELEIENSLERVRAVAMLMKKSDDLLTISKILFEEFRSLGFSELRNTMININYDDKEFFLNYDFGDNAGPTINKYPYDNDFVIQTYLNKLREKEDAFVESIITGDELETWKELRLKNGELPDPTLDNIPVLYYNFYSIATGAVGIGTFQALTEEKLTLLKRFRNVFDLAYRRYIDIEHAEAQARQAQIEVSLERVRTKAMSMQKSDDLAVVVATIFEELDQLHLETLRVGIGILNKEKCSADVWTTTQSENGNAVQISGDEPMDIHPLLKQAFDAWVEQKEDHSYVLEGEDLIRFYRALKNTNFKLPDSQLVTSAPATLRHYYYVAILHAGGLYAFRETPFPDEAKMLMKRFADVFDLTYTRFLDLQKAEAQAREAKIEAALERVRSRTMAMQRSDELQEAANLLFKQVQGLDIPVWSCGYNIFEKDENICIGWMSTEGFMQPPFRIPLKESQTFIRFAESRKNNEQFYVEEIGGAALEAHYKYMLTLPDFAKNAEAFVKAGYPFPSFQINHVVNFSLGNLIFISSKQIPEAWDVFKRFANVFEQTYIRFLDLQQAEAQAREARIEAALERVRTRTMTMQKSDELAETASVVSSELIGLGVQPNRIYIGIIKDESGTVEFWITDEDGSKVSRQFTVNVNRNYSMKKMFDGWKAGKKSIIIDMEGKELADYFHFLNDELHIPFKQGLSQKRRVQSIAYFSQGLIAIASQEPLPEQTISLFERFSGVFNLTYTRFNDLQQAEAQAREATIEAALEKVRGKAMAMQNSNDLSSTASMVFTELRKLGINPIRCGVGLLVKESRKAQLYSATSSTSGDSLALMGWVILSNHPVLENIYESWINNEDYFPELSGEQLRNYYELLLSGLSVPKLPDWQAGEKQYGHFIPFSVGCLYAWSANPYNEAEIKILKRFATIIDLTFRRYMELQKSEASAREAVRQASLDRVRAEIASMRTTHDLEKITPLIWNELTILGVPFIRCGVFIMDDEQQTIHSFLSTPDGKAIAAFHLPYTTQGNMAQVLNHWQHKKIYKEHWDESAFAELAHILLKQGSIASEQEYLSTIPNGGFYLHLLPFLQGMLYVGNTIPLDEDAIKLIQSIADAFSTAYARYEDFNKLEAAKQQVDKTLMDLKQAQTQLVQAEKMASLGELTAGIAHEIQNPLNFVNNFSEVSNELLDEMKSELDKGNRDEAIAIAKGLQQNLEKILNHGKRADAIVKGMLQHSRTSGGQKESTDINVLADEYLRLTYHGLRAKDKNFNASMKTDFDNTIGRINIVPQDIGRMLLNIYNNAFYAVGKKKSQTPLGYEPTVFVTTKKLTDKIEIRIKDNGNGIPQKILDKIFQPFFTTKPTGQGTGLGLSLAYDIVKAHGGEIRVETKEGEGAEFVVELPEKQVDR